MYVHFLYGKRIVYVHSCVFICAYVYAYVHMHVCMHVFTCVYVFIHSVQLLHSLCLYAISNYIGFIAFRFSIW